jgi:hypothetical protein
MFCSVAARLWLRAVSAADWFGNITAVVSANGYNAGSDLSELIPICCANLSHLQRGNK